MTVKKSNLDSSLDSILIHLGDFGKYQIYVFSLVCVAVILHSQVHIAFVFTAMDLDYRCKVPECDGNNPDYSQPWLQNAVPYLDGHPEKCSKYVAFKNDTGLNGNCSEGNFNRHILERCSNFVYAGKEETILQQYDLQCDNNIWKLGMVGTINNIGQFVGLFISGLLSDKYGRLSLLVWGMFLCSICGCARSFMPTYEWFLVFEFLDAAFGAGTYISGFVLGAELVGPKKRVLTGTIISSCYAVGEVMVAISAWLVKSWKPLILILYIPPFFLLSYLWLIPESIRWNLSKGRVEEAKKTLRKLAKVNGKEISEKELETLDNVEIKRNDESNESLNSKSQLVEAVKSSVLMLRLISCCFCWITCAFLFYGLTINSVALAGNPYMDFILTALVEVPAYFACTFIIEKLGRKKSLCYSYLLTGAACLSFIFIPSESRWGSLSVYLIGKFGATASFTALYVITSEMFPTNLRHSFMGTCSTFGRCGSMISPQTPLLALFWKPLPLISFATMSILAGVVTLVFPETLNKQLPDTVKEAENIGKAASLSSHIEASVEQQNPLEKY